MSGAQQERALCLLIGALGGEGGGVLTDWIVNTAHACGYPVQATSIPGVAQRTGATTYYVEIFPLDRAGLAGRQPVFCLTPTAGHVDVVLCSELMEAARLVQAGFVDARTTLIASTHRVYATAEKMQMGDGRLDAERALSAARACAARALLFDMRTEAANAQTVISAVMFGALLGAGVLPLARERAEQAIGAGSKGVEASLRGFAAGYARAAAGGDVIAVSAVRARLPATAEEVVALGRARCASYLDEDYARLYEARVRVVHEVELALGGGPHFALTREAARGLALWMCYEDVARVAELKARAARFAEIRREAGAQPHEPVDVIEFFKPGWDEVADLLPDPLARPLRAWARRSGRSAIFASGVQLRSNAVLGLVQLRLIASARLWRRRSSRYADEQALIERWLAAIAASGELALAIEIAMSARLIKGYSDTHRRGRENFLRILEQLVENSRLPVAERAPAVRAARAAAQAGPEPGHLDAQLARHGIAPRPPRAVPVRFMPRPSADQKR